MYERPPPPRHPPSLPLRVSFWEVFVDPVLVGAWAPRGGWRHAPAEVSLKEWVAADGWEWEGAGWESAGRAGIVVRALVCCRWRAGWRYWNLQLCAQRAEFFSFLPSPVRALSMQETLRSPTPFIYLFILLFVQICTETVRGKQRCGAPAPTRVCVKICAVFRRVWFEWIVLGAFRSRS